MNGYGQDQGCEDRAHPSIERLPAPGFNPAVPAQLILDRIAGLISGSVGAGPSPGKESLT